MCGVRRRQARRGLEVCGCLLCLGLTVEVRKVLGIPEDGLEVKKHLLTPEAL